MGRRHSNVCVLLACPDQDVNLEAMVGQHGTLNKSLTTNSPDDQLNAFVDNLKCGNGYVDVVAVGA